MNPNFEQEVRYRILKILATEPHISQREMSRRMGISLGKTNYVLSVLAEKGIIKMKRLKNAHQKIPYVYQLTPRGLEQKARITARFLKRKLLEYEEIKSQIKEIASEAEKDGSIDLLSDDTLKRLSSTH
jgi:EPS-associated MarR family transcriptional regulator